MKNRDARVSLKENGRRPGAHRFGRDVPDHADRLARFGAAAPGNAHAVDVRDQELGGHVAFALRITDAACDYGDQALCQHRMDLRELRTDVRYSLIEIVPRQGWAAVSTARRSNASIPSIARAPLRSASKCAAHSPIP
ncbi:hypothetical protein [Burkholderia sp. 22313]|uniref:hypothetical protein n=1 Tax=Burkholderia sp. 22313 TaxID=3453908 RepID=UPI003F842CAA